MMKSSSEGSHPQVNHGAKFWSLASLKCQSEDFNWHSGIPMYFPLATEKHFQRDQQYIQNVQTFVIDVCLPVKK